MTIQITDRTLPRWLSVAIIAVLSVVVVSAFLFTVINASTPLPPRGYSQFLADVQAGQVTRVEQEGDTLTVATRTDPYSVVVPSVLTDVYAEMQAAAAKGSAQLPADLYVANASPGMSWLEIVLTAILPVTLVIVIFALVLLLLLHRRGGPPDVTSRLRALDAAWKAGLVTDAERERKRTQILEAM